MGQTGRETACGCKSVREAAGDLNGLVVVLKNPTGVLLRQEQLARSVP